MAERQRPKEQDPKVRCKNFEAVEENFTAEQVKLEASRCLNCKNPQCVKGCPVNINIPAFIAKIKDGDPLANMNDVIDTEWKVLNKKDYVHMEGRIIGGCLDILTHICGSKYDHVNEFIDRYAKDGIIWYFESCDLNILEQLRSYKQLINSNWFKHCRGVIIGRPLNDKDIMGSSYKDVINDCFKDMPFDVLYDLDIGHVAPINSIVNGSIVKIDFKNKKGTIKQELV